MAYFASALGLAVPDPRVPSVSDSKMFSLDLTLTAAQSFYLDFVEALVCRFKRLFCPCVPLRVGGLDTLSHPQFGHKKIGQWSHKLDRSSLICFRALHRPKTEQSAPAEETRTIVLSAITSVTLASNATVAAHLLPTPCHNFEDNISRKLIALPPQACRFAYPRALLRLRP